MATPNNNADRYEVRFDPKKVLRAADNIFRSIIHQKTKQYRPSETEFGLYFTNDPSLVEHTEHELKILEQLWLQTLEDYKQTRRIKIELDNIFT